MNDRREHPGQYGPEYPALSTLKRVPHPAKGAIR
jgi:hypothetical protein